MESTEHAGTDYLEEAKLSFRRLAGLVDVEESESVASREAVTLSLALIAIAEELRRLDKKR